MKIQYVTINGMHHIKNKSYTFEDINYLHGKNGAGKSTILNAIQLALLGYIPGTAKQTSAIFQHASGPEMRIKIGFDNDQTIERVWRIKGRGIDTQILGSFNEKEIKSLIQNLELPIFNFNELINMTANKLKDWFINFLPGDSIEINWEKELRDSLNGLQMMDETLLTQALDTLHEDDGKSLIEKIQFFNKFMKEHQSYTSSELQRYESTVQSLIYYDEDGLIGDAEYLDNEIANAQARIKELTDEKERAIRAQQVINSNRAIRDQMSMIHVLNGDEINALKSQVADLETKIQEAEDSIASDENLLLKKISDRSAIEFDIKSMKAVIESNGVCTYTQTPCESITSMMIEFKSQTASKKSEIDRLSREIGEIQDTINSQKTSIYNLRQEVRRIQGEITFNENSRYNLEQAQRMLQPETDMSNFSDFNFYNEEISRLNEHISKIQANKRYNALVDEMTANKYRLENSIEVFKCWAKLTDPNGLQTKVMEAPFHQLAEDINKYLQIMFMYSDNVECRFNLEQKANSFSFGIIRGTKYIPYDLLSSGEKTMYTLALMLCIVHRTKSNIKLLIIDDMLDHLDDDRADDVFNALREIKDVQVIVAGVKNSNNATPYQIEVM